MAFSMEKTRLRRWHSAQKEFSYKHEDLGQNHQPPRKEQCVAEVPENFLGSQVIRFQDDLKTKARHEYSLHLKMAVGTHS